MSGKTVPGQRKVPFVGSAGQFAQDPLGFLRGLARDYGDTARFSIFHLPFVLISNPDTVRERRSPPIAPGAS